MRDTSRRQVSIPRFRPEVGLDERFEAWQNFLLNELASSAQHRKDRLPCNLFRHSEIEYWSEGEHGVRFDYITNVPPSPDLEAGYYCARFDPAPKLFFSRHPARALLSFSDG